MCAGPVSTETIKLDCSHKFIKFSNLDSAIAYAESKNYKYEVIKTSTKKIKIKSYAENFRYNRHKAEID